SSWNWCRMLSQHSSLLTGPMVERSDQRSPMTGTTHLRSVALLCGLLLFAVEATGEDPKPPRATTEQVQKTVDRAIGYLQTESASWLKSRGCAACHHVPMPLW